MSKDMNLKYFPYIALPSTYTHNFISVGSVNCFLSYELFLTQTARCVEKYSLLELDPKVLSVNWVSLDPMNKPTKYV